MKQQKQQPQPRQPSSQKEKENRKSPPGIGSSQGQDRGSGDMNSSQTTQHGSMVGESTGAFKERP
jgi:hypothetical protein